MWLLLYYISMSFVKNLIVSSQIETKGAESGLLG